MSDQFVGEIRIFGCNFAPYEWAMCDGQLLPISQNTALFSLLGTNFGGNGTSNFALPNLQGRAPMDWGSGVGLTPRVIGEMDGAPSVTVLTTQMPSHNHAAVASTTAGTTNQASNNQWGVPHLGKAHIASFTTTISSGTTTMSSLALGAAGESGAHNNLQPFLVLNFCIALTGVFPSRS